MPFVKNPYQPWELEIIIKHYPKGGPHACIAAGIKRSVQAIATKASNMGVSTNKDLRASIRKESAIRQHQKKVDGHTPWVAPDEYLGARDIFQVGYLVAKSTGTLRQYVRQR